MDKKYNIINYAYNKYGFYGETPEDKQVPSSKDHTIYIEAIIGAIYYDGGYKKVKEWIETWLIAKLQNEI